MANIPQFSRGQWGSLSGIVDTSLTAVQPGMVMSVQLTGPQTLRHYSVEVYGGSVAFRMLLLRAQQQFPVSLTPLSLLNASGFPLNTPDVLGLDAKYEHIIPANAMFDETFDDLTSGPAPSVSSGEYMQIVVVPLVLSLPIAGQSYVILNAFATPDGPTGSEQLTLRSLPESAVG